MNIGEARKIVQDFDENRELKNEEIFLFIEAMEYLIREENQPEDMLYLGGYYYENGDFDLALKYYEMAAAMDYEPAYERLGYIWYYGRTGQKDYKKAFECFQKSMDRGNVVAAYKVADMYRNGYYVEKSQEQYESIIESLYAAVKEMDDLFDPVPEVYTRLARIRKSQGRIDDAINLYLYAKDFLAQRISYNAFWGNLNIMKWMIDDLYTMMEFDEDFFDFYDLFYLLKEPYRICFIYDERKRILESVQEDGQISICFEGKWFRTRDDFFQKAMVDGVKVTALYHDFYGFEVME